MVGLKNWLKSSRILQFLSKLVLQNNLIAHYCFFKQTTEMSICHCLSVKKRVSVKNVKILEMSDFGNTVPNSPFPHPNEGTPPLPPPSLPRSPSKQTKTSSRVVYRRTPTSRVSDWTRMERRLRSIQASWDRRRRAR